LASNYLYRNLLNNLRATIGSAVTGTGQASIRTLADIGITEGSDNSLSISDGQAFSSALASQPDAVAAMFNSADGVGTQLDALVRPFTDSGGYLDTEHTSTDDRISSINDHIARLESKATLRERQLTLEYSALQRYIAVMNSQQSVVNGFIQFLNNNL
jgi:flagellar hook-associated protein 2